MNIAREIITTDSALTRAQKLAGVFVGASAVAAAMLLTVLTDHAQPSSAQIVILAEDDDLEPTLKPFPTEELPDPTLKPFPTQSTTPPAPQRGGTGDIRVPGSARGGLAIG